MNFFKKLEIKANKDGIIKRAVGGVIVNSNNEILMIRRKPDDFMGGILELPSGNSELGESISEALIREVWEETGLKVIKFKSFINTFDYISNSGKKSRQFNFEIQVEDIENIVLTEHDEYKWMSYKEIDDEKAMIDEVRYLLEIFRYNKGL